jgi:DNA-binding CsgD family transcriptional regulator
MMDVASHYVYVMEAVGQPGLIKVGYTREPESRLAAIQLCCPVELRLVSASPCRSRPHALTVERAVHAYLADLRTISEWFRVGDVQEVVDFVKQMASGDASPSARGRQRAYSGDLSGRELQVVNFLADGKSCSEIAIILGRSVKTVSTYTHRAAMKLGLASARDVRHFALRSRHEGRRRILSDRGAG